MGDPVAQDAPCAWLPRAGAGRGGGEVEHQFLNTGLAVRAAIIRRFLDAEGIAYRSEG